ncbi:MAG: hypothetical protein JXA94_07670 [Parachlamydiales bacterium]|nr:hypothetical protein [Parachlamydiales bacterium]
MTTIAMLPSPDCTSLLINIALLEVYKRTNSKLTLREILDSSFSQNIQGDLRKLKSYYKEQNPSQLLETQIDQVNKIEKLFQAVLFGPLTFRDFNAQILELAKENSKLLESLSLAEAEQLDFEEKFLQFALDADLISVNKYLNITESINTSLIERTINKLLELKQPTEDHSLILITLIDKCDYQYNVNPMIIRQAEEYLLTIGASSDNYHLTKDVLEKYFLLRKKGINERTFKIDRLVVLENFDKTIYYERWEAAKAFCEVLGKSVSQNHLKDPLIEAAANGNFTKFRRLIELILFSDEVLLDAYLKCDFKNHFLFKHFIFQRLSHKVQQQIFKDCVANKRLDDFTVCINILFSRDTAKAERYSKENFLDPNIFPTNFQKLLIDSSSS